MSQAVVSAAQNELQGKLAELLKNAPSDVDSDGSARIALAILNAETLDDVAAIFSGMDNAKQYMDIPLMIKSFTIRDSTKDGGVGVYATINATVRATGNDIMFNCGATSVVATLLVAHERDWFPFTAHLTSKETSKGNTVYNLIPDE